MSVKVEKISGCKIKLTFKIPAERFNQGLDQAFEKKVKDISVPGFRKGKLPRSMYNARFGEESLYSDAIDIVANEAFLQEIKKGKHNIVGNPELDLDFKTVGRDKPLHFTIEVEVWPDVELGQYKEIEVEKESTEVTDEDVEEYVNRILKQHAELEVVEGKPVENGFTAVFDFEGSVDGVPFEGGKAENYSLEIGSGQFIPGFEDQMIGMNLEEEKVLHVTFPTDYHAENLAGKEAEFKVVVHELKQRIIPELTDEFVKDELEIKDVNTKEEYLSFVRETLLSEKTEASNNKFLDDVVTKVLENAKVDLPESLVEEEIERQVKQIENQAKRYGLTVDLLLQYSGLENLESYKKTIRPSAEIAVKQRAVFLEIAKVEKFKVSAKDYKNEIKTIMSEMNISEEEAMKRFPKDSITPYLLMEKAKNLIKETANMK